MLKQTIAIMLTVALASPSSALQVSAQSAGQTQSTPAQPPAGPGADQKGLLDEIRALSGLGGSATRDTKDPCSLGLEILPQKQILVEEPKIYDDAVMQQQLEANFSRLATLSGFDQSSLTSHLGNVSGVNQSFASGSLSVQGPSTNQAVTTATIPSVQTVATNTVSSGTAASNGVSVPVLTNQGVTQTTSNPATNQTVTTQPSVTVPNSTPPPITPVATTGFSVQSPAILSEQLQLASRLNTELLADEGALSDRVISGIFLNPITNTNEILFTTMRPTVTVGFDFTVTPEQREKDAAAVVEAIVANCADSNIDARIPPAITALIPSEATYNVAAVRNTAMNLGGGIATAFLGASGSFLFGHNQYFLVQDEDTIAQVFRPTTEDRGSFCGTRECVGVRWILRPVLGQRFVGQQRRKVVMQLAFPSFASSSQYGELTVRASWRHFDRKSGLVGAELKNSQALLYRYPVGNIRLGSVHPQLSAQSTEDLGNGQVMVRLNGSYLSGTYVRIGNQVLVDALSGLVREQHSLRFIASASDLMSKDAFLVSRSGDPISLVNPRAGRILPPRPGAGLSSTPVTISTLDAINSRVTVSYCEVPDPNRKPDASAFSKDFDPILVLIAGKVYGLSDAPLARTDGLIGGGSCPDYKVSDKQTVQSIGKTLALTIPTATLLASPVVNVKRLFEGPNQTFQFPLTGNRVSPMSQTDRLVLLSATKAGAEFLLYGNGLNQVDSKDTSAVDPPVKLAPIPDPAAGPDTADAMRYVSLSKDQLTQYKFLVITRKGQAPEAIAIPTVTLPDSGGMPTVNSTVLKGDDEAVVTGTGLNTLADVQFQGKSIPFTPAKDGKSPVILLHLRKAGVTNRTSLQSLDFYFKQGPVKVKMDVFSGLVQTSARPETEGSLSK
jgi:hypothetical protein